MSRGDLTFLYDQVVEALARLHAFSAVKEGDWNGRSNNVEDDVDHVAELMAKRDLLIFAASARNFAEACKAVDEARDTKVAVSTLVSPPAPPFFLESGETISLYQALSRILHSNMIEIFRMEYHYEVFLSSSSDDLFQKIGGYREKPAQSTEPILAVKSERDPLTAIRLRTLVWKSSAFLEQVSERLAVKEKIFLQRDFREL